MRIKAVLCWCLLVIRISKCDNEVKDREVPRMSSWVSAVTEGSSRGYSLVRDAVSHAASHAASHDATVKSACEEDLTCLGKKLGDPDRQGLEAIQLLHKQLDDDDNGNVDLSESDDFLREELQYDSGYERRQQAFHHNDDMHISPRELWEAWLRSEVHNWTVEQTTEWLEKSVELPQYMKTFVHHRVTGATLPRLAVNNMHFLSGTLGIKDPIHKQKIALKAMDVVLFGPPKDGGHRWKDGVLVALILGVVVGCWWAYQQGRASRRQLHRMLKDMESLRRAELALDDLQKELERARLEQENVATEKLNLERRLMEAGSAGISLTTSYSDLEVSHLKAEIEMLRQELQRAEGELEDRCWAPPAGLQLWLQLTHELENKSYLRKKNGADQQLQQAREACEKLRKKRSSLVGAFVSTHGKSIDDVDRSIVEARTALNEVTQELQERVHRWKQMELLCGFNIINNSGLQYLETALYRNSNGRPNRLRVSSSQDDLDMEESGSLFGGTTAADLPSMNWKEDSSGSEELEPTEGRHYPMDLRLAEARQQMEERRAAEDRKAAELRSQYMDRIQEYRNYFMEQKAEDRLNSNGRPKDSIQFTLGGDNVNWTGEDLSQTGSVASMRVSRSQPNALRQRAPASLPPLPRGPIVPPRRVQPPAGALVKSRSTEAGLEECGANDPPTPPRNNNSNNRLASLSRHRTVGSEIDTGSSSSEQSLPAPSDPASATTPVPAPSPAPAPALQLPASVPFGPLPSPASVDLEPRPRRRKIQFPFSKKSKTPSANQS